MSFSVSRDYGDFEWSGISLKAMFAPKWSLLSPKRWCLIFDIVRFNQFALDMIINEDERQERPSGYLNDQETMKQQQESIGDYLDREGYSQPFRDDYLLPVIAMVWSTTPDKCSLRFPVITLIRFMWNQHLMNTVTEKSDWLTIPGGTKQYIEAAMKDFPKHQVHLNTKVTAAVTEAKGKVKLRANGEDLLFDHVILATHGNQALKIVKIGASRQELDVLEGFRTNHNIAVLHSDPSLMPQRRITWSAWNFITETPFPPNGSSNVSKICLTYWVNLLQHIPEHKFGPILVTLNPLHPPKTELTHGVWEYSHPVYDAKAVRSQGLLPIIQNRRSISYCGAWSRYGFHEDGFSSGLAAAVDHLGAQLPFDFVDPTSSPGRRPVLSLRNHVIRIVIHIIRILILLGEIWLTFFTWLWKTTNAATKEKQR